MPDDVILSASQATALLGISRSQFYQKLGGTRQKADGTGITVATLRQSFEKDYQARLDFARGLVEGCDDAVIATSLEGTIMAVSRAAERLLHRSAHDLVNRDVADIGVLPTSRAGAPSVLVAHEWQAHPREPVLLHRWRGGQHGPVPRELSCGRRKEVEQELRRTKANRGGKWDWTKIDPVYPPLGSPTIEATVRCSDAGIKPAGLRLHHLSTRSLASDISEDTSAMALLPLPQAVRMFDEVLRRYAQVLCRQFLAEATSIFIFRPRFITPIVHLDDSESDRPRTLVTLASYGFPEPLTRGEIFYGEGPGRGLVLDVLEEGEAQIIDFDDPATRERVRQPNYGIFSLNSRLGRLRNAVIAPIMLGQAGAPPARHRQAFGAIRLLNCYHPTGNPERPFDYENPEWMLSEIKRIARQLALMYAQLLAAARVQLINCAVENLADAPTLDGFLRVLTTNVLELSDFDHVVVWRCDGGADGDLTPHEYAGIRRDRLQRGCTEERYARRALQKGGLVTIGKEHTERAPDCRTRGASGALDVHNGFVVPIARFDGTVWGALAFYNSWAADEPGPYGAELADLCDRLAKLIGVRIDIDAANRRTESGPRHRAQRSPRRRR